MKRSIGFALLFTAVYILVFSSPLKKDPVFEPDWVQNLADPAQLASSVAGSGLFGFRIGKVFGYATPAGAIRYLDTAQFNVAMAGEHFINYSSVSEDLVEKNSAGRIILTIPSRGYPIFRAGRFFVIDTDRTSLSELSSQGATLWHHDFGSLITSMAANTESVVVGLLNGSLLVLDRKGRVVYSYAPSGSKIAAIYGCAVSAGGSHIALVSGLDPQRLILLRRYRSGYRPERVLDLRVEQRRQVFLHFYPHLPYVYVELPGSVEYLPLSHGSAGSVPVDGRIMRLAHGGGRLLYAVSEPAAGVGQKSAPPAELTVFTPSGEVIARSRVTGGRFYLRADGESVYLGADMRLMRFDYALE